MDFQQTNEIIKLLHRQNELLEQIANNLNNSHLGFHDDAGVTRVYCNRSNGFLWYTLANGTPVEIKQSALTGYLRELKFERVMRRGKEVCKLCLNIEADGMYLLESGYDSHFSKCVLSAIALLTPEQLRQPITIAVSPGSDDAVLFARVYFGAEYIKAPYTQHTNFRKVAKQAISAVKAANA